MCLNDSSNFCKHEINLVSKCIVHIEKLHIQLWKTTTVKANGRFSSATSILIKLRPFIMKTVRLVEGLNSVLYGPSVLPPSVPRVFTFREKIYQILCTYLVLLRCTRLCERSYRTPLHIKYQNIKIIRCSVSCLSVCMMFFFLSVIFWCTDLFR